MNSRVVVLLVVWCLPLVRDGRAQSPDQLRSGDSPAFEASVTGEAVDRARRQELTDSILDARQAASHRRFSDHLRSRLGGMLASVPSTALEAFASAGGLGNIEALVRAAWSPSVLGDAAADLVFTPVTPCRIINTTMAGGILNPGTPRSFFVNGGVAGTFETQGGTPGGCGVPDAATSVAMNFVAVGPAGPGNLRAYPYSASPTVPNASVINYSNVSGLNIANGLAQPVCNAATAICTFDIIVREDVAASHLVVDVVGYYQRALEVATTMTASSRGTPLNLTAACQAVTSCTITNPTPIALGVSVEATVNTRLEHIAGGDDIVNVAIAFNPTTCTSPLGGGVGAAWVHVDNVIGTSCCFENSVSPRRLLGIAPGATSTFFVNAVLAQSSGGTVKVVDGADISCALAR
jgi:hypothetical protein